jgi:hypothetical protein
MAAVAEIGKTRAVRIARRAAPYPATAGRAGGGVARAVRVTGRAIMAIARDR